MDFWPAYPVIVLVYRQTRFLAVVAAVQHAAYVRDCTSRYSSGGQYNTVKTLDRGAWFLCAQDGRQKGPCDDLAVLLTLAM